ncbi:MAG: HAD hydrolase-like protein, partial [Candidatus Aenigmatarchaeota archaeon]
EKDVEKIGDFMKKELGVDDVYNCFHHPEFTGECECRKPRDGMIKKAVKDYGIDIGGSFLVGDNLSDIEAGGGCKATFLIVRKKTADLLNLIEETGTHPTHMVKSLEEAVGIILS